MSAPSIPLPLKAAPDISDWIRFGPGRTVEVLTGRVELGQGNLTALAQMAADELGLAPNDVVITSGNTERTPNEGYTAGSMSVSIGGMALRFAASAARVLVLREASLKLNADYLSLSVRDGDILEGGRPTDLDLRDVATGLNFAVPVIDYAALLVPERRTLSSQPLPRRDLPNRIFGTPFIHDFAPEGMVHGRILHPPVQGAMLRSLDLKTLAARPGIIDVFRDGSVVGILAGSFSVVTAAVDWAANRAEWAVPDLPQAASLRELLAGAASAETVILEKGKIPEEDGNAVEVTASRAYLSHGSIGPSAAMAVWRDGRLKIWSHSQGVFQLRNAVARVLGLDIEAISIEHASGAGCYGHNGADDAAFDAALLARRVPGKPVKVIWSRLDEFRVAPLGPGMLTTARAVVDETGALQSASICVTSAPHGNRPDTAGVPNLVTATRLAEPVPFQRSNDVPLPQGGADRNAIPYYRVPNLHVGKKLVHDLPYRTSSLRALGAHLNIFAIEMLMEKIAAETGQDPVTLRLRHLDDPRAAKVIETVMAEGEALRRDMEPGAEGWGLGFGRYKNTGAYAAVLARIRVEETVTVSHIHAAVDSGEIVNPDGALNQIEGGILQAVSWTLKEEVKLAGPLVATETWLDYPILRFSEVPQVAVTLIDRPEDPPLGCAEAMAGPVAAAIGSALFQALGIQICDLPLTRERIMAAALA
ncbi:molybdopterin cofactor-binding domain-containing protein [Roseibium marinum]|uniref:CO/xanthine dehydrogenase Mo-binding subunit n=1 Tax=Roseibium marinum TaxID=281252 RepID=A0A2S3V0T9_9HYPH|nr:molybdopterin cofactor-binding domain-containing protein [Roseibium marinum]POF33587.1 CO/xanthine dehydrogenase Mo-binding subunit [Roseibium marinum]